MMNENDVNGKNLNDIKQNSNETNVQVIDKNDENKNVISSGNTENQNSININGSEPSGEKGKKKKKSVIGTIFGIIGKLVLIALLALAITILVRVFVYQKFDIFGFRLYQIMSGSMEPTIHVGDAVITKEVSELNEGDILAYENGQSITVHRVIKVYTEGDKRMYEAQGDNNNAPDQGLIMPEQVKGKVVFTVKKAGEGINLLRKYGIIVLIFAVGIIVIVALIRRLL